MLDLSFLHESAFYELTALLMLAAMGGFIGLLLRQPMVVAFIGVGILAGTSGLNIVQSYEHIHLLAELGIAVLLFLVGLKLDLKLVRTLGNVSLATGLGQVAFTAIVGFLITWGLGMGPITALYVSVALTFSSTIIIVKLLSDKNEADSLHGRIAIGFLIVQDVVVVLAMMVLSAFNIGAEVQTENGVIEHVLIVCLYGVLMLGIVGIFVRYLATPLVNRVAHSPELLITFSIGWAALLAALGSYLGFSKELGGLLAGVSLASTPFREAIVARLSSLRDFLLLFFFIAFGSQLELNLLGTQMLPALTLSLFVLVGNPLIVMIIMGAMGYRKRTGFLAGLTVAQISEFSLIFMAMGLTLGHVSGEAVGLVTLVGLITITLSVYMITYSHTLYSWLEPILGIFERHFPYAEENKDVQYYESRKYDIILFGLGRYGAAIAAKLKKEGYKLLMVDFNPDVVRQGRKAGYEIVYGDACDPNFLDFLPLQYAKWIISTIPQREVGLVHDDPRVMLMHGLKQQKYPGKTAISTRNPCEVDILINKGVDLVFVPYQDAADRAVERIKEAM